MSTIDEIKSRIDIVDLVSETVQLRRSGKNFTGFCPFHPNTRTPAFVVFPETGTWRCFGQCNEGGDIFGFVMKKEGWDFSEALYYLAENAGVELRPLDAEERSTAEEHDNLRAILEEAVVYYRHQLLNSPAGKRVHEYLSRERGLSDETIEVFGLGYAPQSWNGLLIYFKSRGYSEADLLACGLLTEREALAEGERDSVYDRFRHRIMFPIRDERGRMAGFGARVVEPDDVPKFLNSPQTAIFDKGKLLYGLDRARKGIRAADQVVIVEGYLDVIALHQAGFTNVVSPMGTALTEAQLRLLKRFTRRVVLALDADAAGDRATLRGLDIARQSLDRSPDPVFDARGLLGYEARLQADIRVTTLPEGTDPDEIVGRNSKEWAEIVANARPVVVHIMEALARQHDLNDSKEKSALAKAVLPLIEDIPDAVEREDYRQRLARLLKVDERALMEWKPIGRTRERRRAGVRQQSATSSTTPPKADLLPGMIASGNLEAHCLSVLLRKPELVYRLDRTLQQEQLTRLAVEDFESAEYQLIFRLIEESLRQDQAEPLNYVLNNLSLPLMDLVDQLLVRTEKLDPNENRVLEDLVRTLIELRKRRLHQQLEHIRFLIEEAQESGDRRAAEYQQVMVNFISTRVRLDQALGHYTSHIVQ